MGKEIIRLEGIKKSYGQSEGIQSYGTVVDLLVAYY